MRATIFYKQFFTVLIAVLCGAGTWTYASRILIPRQEFDAAVYDRPRGNLSDLYPRWEGARELLLNGRDPYSAEVSGEIQAGYYGRVLDPSRPNEPTDQQGFAYPVYVVFGLAPTIRMPFAFVQKGFFWMLLFLTAGSCAVWLRILRCSVSLSIQIALVALTLGNVAVMQGLKLQQISLLVVPLIAIATMLLTARRVTAIQFASNQLATKRHLANHIPATYAVTAGILLAVATIKPQLVVLLLGWLGLWTLADWRRRHLWAVSFLSAMALLMAASEWYLPHWIPRFWHAVQEYERYTGAMSVISRLIGSPWSSLLEFLAFGALALACWRERRQPADSRAFALIVSLVLATTMLFVPGYAPYNQVLLIPALLLLVKDRRTIWQRSILNRLLFAITIGLVAWPSLSSTVLAALSFTVAQRVMERAWAVPLWTLTQIPVGVAGMMMLHYYQETAAQGAFTAPASPGTS
jgi:hypothetical protein